MEIKLDIMELSILHMAICKLQEEVPVESWQGRHYSQLGDKLYREMEGFLS